MRSRAIIPRVAMLGILLVIALVCLGGAAQAGTTITVNTTVDVVTDDGQCSLREAITAANTDMPSGLQPGECAAGSGDDIIALPAGTYALRLVGADEDDNITGDLDIRSDVSIGGSGTAATVISGGGECRILDVHGGATVTISDLTVTGGHTGPSVPGGGMRNDGTLTLNLSRVIGNSAGESTGYDSGSWGGGIANIGGSLTLNYSSVAYNESLASGGIANSTGEVILNHSAVHDNRASGYMSSGFTGGIWNGGTMTIINSTVTGNFSFDVDGGISNCGTLTISDSTITDNGTAVGGFTGIAHGYCAGPSHLAIRNTIVAGNDGADLACGNGTVTSHGYNLVGNGAYCIFTATTGDRIGSGDEPIDPLLGPLRDNGGPTFTHALLPGSPAIDAGNPATPGSGGNACEATDQRGVSRPQGVACDIGAYESVPPEAVPGFSQWGLIGTAGVLVALFAFRRWAEARRRAA